MDATHVTDDEEGKEDDDDDVEQGELQQGQQQQQQRLPSIRRVGSRQMLVFLTDGNTIGELL